MERGFTLVEIMVSVAILSIGLVLILQGLAFSLGALRIAEDNLTAILAAESKMAEARILAKEDWDKLKSGLDEKWEFADLSCQWKVEVNPVQWPSEEIPKGYEDLNQIEATLIWQEGRQKGKIPLVTLMRRNIQEK